MPPKKNFFDKMSNGQKITLIVAVIGGCCVVVAALIGLGVPVVGFLLEQSATKNALATPTFLPPTGSIELPSSQQDILSVVINSSTTNAYSGQAGVITKNVDSSTTPKITIKQTDVIQVGDVTPKISFVGQNGFLLFEIYLEGKANDEDVQITNRIPIQVSYESIPDKVNLYITSRPGGGTFYSVLSADISSKDKQAWAQYSSDFREQFLDIQLHCPNCVDSSKLPTELQKYLSGNDPIPPDFFLLKKNEKIGIPIVLLFQNPGIYHLKIGAEYIYRQYKSIAWTQPEIEVYVPKNHDQWICDNPFWETPVSSCQIEWSCTIKADGSPDCKRLYNP